MAPTVAARAAIGQARRMRLPGTPRAVAAFHPFQLFLAGALLARNPRAELWYGRPADEELEPGLDAALAGRGALGGPAGGLLEGGPPRVGGVGGSSRPAGGSPGGRGAGGRPRCAWSAPP